LIYIAIFTDSNYEQWGLKNGADTVGEFKSAEMGVSHTPSWKAKKLRKFVQEKVLLEP
jgi:hypothetical protein